MTGKKILTPKLLKKIEKEMVRGYDDDKGVKQYPTLKKAAGYHNVSYDALRQKARKWKWKVRRTEYQEEVSRKVQEKKEIEIESEREAEKIVVEDVKFNKAANLIQQAVTKTANIILEEKAVIAVTKEGEVIRGIPKNAAYQLMNLGKALEAAQKVSKTAAGEPAEINETRSNSRMEFEGRYTYTKRLICSRDHIQHEVGVLHAAGEAQGCG